MTQENAPQFEGLKSRLQQNPDSLIFARVADGLLQRGHVEEAIRVCEEGIRKHPYYVTGHMVLGKCYLQKKLFDLAEKEFKRVILFDPKYLAAHKFYGDLMREVGWENTCEMSYRKILQIDPLDKVSREMLETLERVKPREQEIVGPREEKIDELTSRAEEELIGSTAGPEESGDAANEAAATAVPGGPRPAMQAEAINLDDDLFAEVGNRDDEYPNIDEKAEGEAEISGILDDIFDEEESTAPADAAEIASPAEKTARDLFEDEKTYAPPAPNAPEQDPMSSLDSFDEETIEFDKLDDLEAEAETHLKPEDVDDFDMFEDDEEAGESQTADFPESLPGPNAPREGAAASDGAQTESELTAGEDVDELPDFDFVEPEPPRIAATRVDEAASGSETAEEEESDSLAAGPRVRLDREKIVTPTLGEIYAAQGQYGKAISVFEMLLKKDPANSGYQEKINFLQKRLEESQNV